MTVRTLSVPDLLSSKSQRAKNGCLEWTAGRDWDGYGIVSIDGRSYRAHRVAYEVATGQKIPPDLMVRHSCDNPPCIEPSHLLVGSGLDNVRDRQSRGRSADRNGERCPTAKLTWEKVRAIRALLAQGHTHQSIADQYGVKRECITAIARGVNWRPERDPALQQAG